MRRLYLLVGLLVGLLLVGTAPVRATVIVTAEEIGGDVVFSGSGTLDLTAWTGQFFGFNSGPSIVQPAGTRFTVGATSLIDLYSTPSNYSAPSPFGPGISTIAATSGSGDQFGIVSAASLYVPHGYASGGALSGSATYAGETFASLGMTPGTYVWSWGSGSSADSLTLNIVPEPTAVLLLATGLAGLAWRSRRH